MVDDDGDGVGVVEGKEVTEGTALVCASTVLIKTNPKTKNRGNMEAPFILNKIDKN